FDTTAAIVRRKLTGRSLYSTDRGHLHHCLLRRGYSNSRVLLWVSVLCSLTVLGALASLTWHNEFLAIFSMLSVVAILVVTKLFGQALGRVNMAGRRDKDAIWAKVATLTEIVEQFETQASEWLTAKAHFGPLAAAPVSRVS